jgi:hypothetical protein
VSSASGGRIDASNIPTIEMIAAQSEIEEMMKGLMTALKINEAEAKTVIESCAAEALTAMGKIAGLNDLRDFVIEAVNGEIRGNSAGLLKAAGIEEGKAVLLQAIARRGKLNYAAVSEEELGKLYVPKSGVIAYMKGASGDTGHVVLIKGVKDGKVSYAEAGTMKEATEEEFRRMGFSGLLLMSRYAKGKNKGVVSDTVSSSEDVKKFFGIEEGSDFAVNREYAGGRKLADTIVNGVTEGTEQSTAVLYVLNIWKNMEEMAGALGTSIEKVRSEGEVEITKGEYEKVGEAVEAGANNELSPGEVMAEVKLLSTVRDLLIGVVKGDSELGILLDKKELKEGEIRVIMSSLTESKAVNHNVMIAGLGEAKRNADAKVEEREELIDVGMLKKAMEEKEESRIALFAGRFFGSRAKLEEVLPSLGNDTFVNVRGTMMSPMMSRALAASA